MKSFARKPGVRSSKRQHPLVLFRGLLHFHLRRVSASGAVLACAEVWHGRAPNPAGALDSVTPPPPEQRQGEPE
jgi:hypothetical protein